MVEQKVLDVLLLHSRRTFLLSHVIDIV